MPHINDTPSPALSPTTTTQVEDARLQKIRIKNRRKLYLDRHPSYFTAPDLELADPLLYDRCIRRFQTAAEREEDGRKKGYSGVLEADLWRSEAKVQAIQAKQAARSQKAIQTSQPIQHTSSESSASSNPPPPNSSTPTTHSLEHLLPTDPYTPAFEPEDPNPDDDTTPSTRAEGLERWTHEMTLRFLRGEDEDFDYGDVDESEEWDIVERRENEERWFDEETPRWVGDEEEEDEEQDGDGDGDAKGKVEKRGGDTGVQDF